MNKIARSQNILRKFYKNRNSLSAPPEHLIHNFDYSQFATTTNNYTTINNFNLNQAFEPCSDYKQMKCLISLPTLTVEYDNQSDFKNSFASQMKLHKIDSPNHYAKILKIQMTSPYVDLFSNKEIEFKLESGLRSSEENESVDYSSSAKRKYSMENHSEKTPSFSQDISDDIVEIISITNITHVNTKKRPVYSAKNSTLKVPNMSVRVKSADKKGKTQTN